MGRIAVIGGTGFDIQLSKDLKEVVKTPFGLSQPIYQSMIGGLHIKFLPRHGPKGDIPPHRVNFRANIWALKEMEVERIIALNAAGAVNPLYKPRDIVIPHDIIDLTDGRNSTFFEESPVYNVDVSEPYCPELRRSLIEGVIPKGNKLWKEGIYACTNGPRFETPAEIKAIARIGGDLVGMTGAPEVFLARELNICYASLCYVSNMAAGLQKRITGDEVKKIGKVVSLMIFKALQSVFDHIPKDRNCICKSAMDRL